MDWRVILLGNKVCAIAEGIHFLDLFFNNLICVIKSKFKSEL